MKFPVFVIALAALPAIANLTAASAQTRPHAETAAGAATPQPDAATAPEAAAIVAFWKEAGPALWFAKDDDFDRRFRTLFLPLYETAALGGFAGWKATPDGALALLVLLDQFPRNAFRGTDRMYATDAMAREIASEAIAAGHDRRVPPEMQVFFVLPFGHSEALVDQDRAVSLAERLGEPHVSFAQQHRDIIRRFGRFPHRNAVLGRSMTTDEQKFLDDGGFAG